MPVYLIDHAELLQVVFRLHRIFLTTNFTGKPMLLFSKSGMALTVELMVSALIAVVVNVQTVGGVIQTYGIGNVSSISTCRGLKLKQYGNIITAVRFL